MEAALSTLRFQLQDTVLLFGTVLLLDPVHFRKYEACILIGSILNFEAHTAIKILVALLP